MRKYKFQCWNVAFRQHSEDIENNKETFTLIPNTFRYWAADPFIIKKDEIYFIFAELYDKFFRKGHIGYCKIAEDGKILSKWKKCIKSSVHMSFPFTIVIDDRLFLMPESGKEHELRIYESHDFPNKWRISKKLLTDVQICDTIEIGKYLWTYDNFRSEWNAKIYTNDNNQISLLKEIPDTKKRLRPGGKAFQYKGLWVVPMQNGEGEYGRSLYFTQIDLSDTSNIKYDKILFELSDENVSINRFDKPIIGLHTYNYNEKFEVIDIKTRQFSWGDIIGLILKKIRL